MERTVPVERARLEQNKDWVYISADKVAKAVAAVRFEVMRYSTSGDDQEVFDHPLVDFSADRRNQPCPCLCRGTWHRDGGDLRSMRDRNRSNPPPPDHRKEASVTAFKKFYRIHSWAVYGACLLDPDGIDADHAPDLDDTALGAAAREALLASRFIDPDHPDWDRVDAFWKNLPDRELLDRFMASAGVKTHGALYSGVGEVGLTLKNGVISLRPMKYEGRGGFTSLRRVEPTDLPESVSDEELGAEIRRLVEISRKPWKR